MNSIVIGTAGHIDHGKSALVKALTGTDPDRLKEERERGITIDLGFAHAVVAGLNLAFVDVPGHERFVRNMLAGAGGIDAVLLVIAATESVMPQTVEHFEICRLLGLSRGVVALTKIDAADRDLVALAEADARALVAGTALETAAIVPVSARTGEGLDALRSALAAIGARPERRQESGTPRVPIDRAFAVKGSGAVVTGTLMSGRLAEGDALAVFPAGRAVRVRGLQIHGAAAPETQAPQRVAVNLAGIEVTDVHRGMTLAAPEHLAVTRRLDARVELLATARALKHGARVRVHQGTDEGFGRVVVGAVRPTRAEPWRPARPGDQGVEIPPGGEAFVRLRLERPMAVTRRDRIILRAYSPPSTIAGGVILDPEPPPSGVRRPTALGRFERLDGEAPVAVFLAESAGRGLTEGDLVRRAGLPPAASRQEAERLVSVGLATRIGDRLFPTAALAAVRERIGTALAEFHRQSPSEPGLPRETLRTRVAGRDAADLFDAALEGLRSAGAVRGTDRIALATFRGDVAPAVLELRAAIERRLAAAALAPPDVASLASEFRTSTEAVDRALRALAQEGRIARVGAMHVHSDALATVKADLRAWRDRQPPGTRVVVDVGMVKTKYGLTRKFAIPLLEWLDRERVTRRVGDSRVLL